MGPLVPDIVSNDLNLVVALIIGVLFGAILEQAGFSTSRKLVGLFYGYDFTVLKVFFTAGVVAMVGVMTLSHFGLLDITLIYINPTYLWSALVGGVLMGLGFVIGGFCPGTSICAAATGKTDALIFIGGAFVGVLTFGEAYGLFEGLYKAGFMGNPRIFETLEMSQSAFALSLIITAWLAFIAVSAVEKKVNRRTDPLLDFNTPHIAIAGTAIFLAVAVFFLPDRKTYLIEKYSNDDAVASVNVPAMSIDEFAFRLMDERDDRVQVIDFRSPERFNEMSLPKSFLFSIDNLFEKEPNQLLMTRNKIRVFVADDEIEAKRIALIADELGYRNIKVLTGGLNSFRREILEFKGSTEHHKSDVSRFRQKASLILPVMIEGNKSAGPVRKTQKRVIGGC